MNVAEILNKAADLIEPEGAWTQGALARGPDGFGTESEIPPNAVCFCAEGAIQASSGRGNHSLEKRAFDALRKVLPTDFIHEWNDKPCRTQAEVVAALRAAAEKAAEKETTNA